MSSIRTRFAPSPTGYLHVGSIRTAVFAWLVARQSDGQFILRIEDTDKQREVEGSIEHLLSCLKALGIDYDEGPDKPGQYGPYLQSQRLDLYRAEVMKLLKERRAYIDPYSPEELDSFRSQAKNSHQPFLFRNYRPSDLDFSYKPGKPIRFKSEPKDYIWKDAIMGELSAGKEAIDDFILMKSDGYPTYNFAHIVDDQYMKITHVIRGQEFISSTPNYLNLYEAMGINKPILATAPPVLGPSGNKKLSKRDGAKDVLEYIKEGYLPEALVNFITSLGWNDGTEQEIFSISELTDKFSLDRVQRSGARFDERRLLWMNGLYIRQMDLDDLAVCAKDYWPDQAVNFSDEYKKQVLSITQDRLKYFSELTDITKFFFISLPINLELITNNKQLKKLDISRLKAYLETTMKALETSNFEVNDLTEKLNNLLKTTDSKPIILFSLIRIAVTQAPSSPGLADTMHVLGKDKSLQRISDLIDQL